MSVLSAHRRAGSAAGAVLLSSLVWHSWCGGGDGSPGASENPVNAAPLADFGAHELSGRRPFSVQFSDATSGEAAKRPSGCGISATERPPRSAIPRTAI